MIERFGAFEGFVGESFEGSDGADSSDIAAIYIYIVIWLEHHGNRPYG